MKNKDDPMVKDLIKLGVEEIKAIQITLWIRSNIEKYFQIINNQ